MLTLGIDACLGHCSVAVLRDETVLAACSEKMARGHVERLAPMAAQVLTEADVAAHTLGLIGVTCGPGGFTGARLGVAFARGLALAAGCRAVGVTTLEALAFPYASQSLLVALDGRRDDLFVQVFGDRATGPQAISVDTLDDFAASHGVPRIFGPQSLPPIDAADVALLALTRPSQAAPPSPIYLRAPDAKAAALAVLR